jgi:DNA-binding NarL/FixJ family response regulator
VLESKILKLLVVEDDPEDEQLICEALVEIEEDRLWINWYFASIVPVDRLEDALCCLASDSFDAILLNLSLPDSPALLESFLEVSACTSSTPILVLADEPDECLANRLLREGAQDVLVKSEIECLPLARAIRFAIERQRRLESARLSALIDPLTGVLTRAAFLNLIQYRDGLELAALIEITKDREHLDLALIQTAEQLRRIFSAPDAIARWDRNRLCVLAAEGSLHRAASRMTNDAVRFSLHKLDDLAVGQMPLRAKTAMLAD